MIAWTLLGLSLAAHLALYFRNRWQADRWSTLCADMEWDVKSLRVRNRELREQHAAMAKKILALQKVMEEMP